MPKIAAEIYKQRRQERTEDLVRAEAKYHEALQILISLGIMEELNGLSEVIPGSVVEVTPFMGISLVDIILKWDKKHRTEFGRPVEEWSEVRVTAAFSVTNSTLYLMINSKIFDYENISIPHLLADAAASPKKIRVD